MMSFITFASCIELGLIYGLMTLGIYLSYRILNVADLTVDGSFTFGAGVSVMFALGGHPVLGLFGGAVAGALAGMVTAFLQTKLRIQPILAGILTMTALYTINIWVMGGKPNVALLNVPTVFTWAEEVFGKQWGSIVVGLGVAVVVCGLVVVFLHTPLGLAIRATGDNEAMVSASSINVDFTKMLGLMVANALVGMSGALIGQNQSFADANMGVGMVIIGLASLIIGEIICVNIGEFILGRRSIVLHMFGVMVGSIVYRLIISQALEWNFSASSMKLVSAVIIATAISYPVIKGKLGLYKKMKVHHNQKKEDSICSN